MNDVALNGHGGALAKGQPNFFEAYGEQASQKSIVGTLVKFSKGDWLIHETGKELPPNTQMVANMDQLLIGWVRWANSKPTDQIMGHVAQGYVPPKRNTLGDEDESLWEVDNQGKSRDPWQLTNYLVLKDNTEGAELYTFGTSSRGGINAVGDLCKAYGKASRMRPDEYPVVALRVDSYLHGDKAYGRIKVPVLTIVGWSDKAGFEADENDKAEQAKVDYASDGAKVATATRF